MLAPSRNLRWLFGTLLLAALGAALAGMIADRRTVATQRADVAQDARLRAALLDSEVERFRLLPLTLAEDRDVVAALAGSAAARGALDRKLAVLARVTGAPAIYVIGRDGRSIAASNWQSPQSFVGRDYRFRRYYRDALSRGEGSQFALGNVSRRPGLYFARRTAEGGVIVIKLEFDRVERAWAHADEITFVRDSRGVVLVASRPDWRFSTTRPLSSVAAARFRADASISDAPLARLPLADGGDGRVRLAGGTRVFVAHDVQVGQPGWTLTQMRRIDDVVGPVRWVAATGAAALVITLGAIAWVLRQRARLARRRTSDLEQAVAERTADLRREAEERAAVELRAAELRESLRQANRLASLGQITASVAHETAQPVAAIRTYAQTSELLLERGDDEAVRANLRAIAGLADRAGAVTTQLRAFARRRAGALRPVALMEVIDGARLILKEQLREATLELPATNRDVRVIGGKVRLEQVLVNLLQNALEAMNGVGAPRITLAIACDGEHVRLTVADTGPGIAPDIADRLFTPFTTSREQGLGLGLVIAQDIMAELGGWLRVLPAERGACFEVGARRA